MRLFFFSEDRHLSNYIQTFSGAKVHLPFNDPGEIVIADIAHALSNACRFAGHTHRHWSVAQHSMCVSDLVPEEHKLQALLHDATEAYLCDIPTPFKKALPEYGTLEAQLWRIIAKRFGVAEELHPSVKEADAVMLMTERDMLCTTSKDWGDVENLPRRQDIMLPYLSMTHEKAEEAFRSKYDRLVGY